MPSMLQGPSWTPRTRGARSARTSSQQRARVRASVGVYVRDDRTANTALMAGVGSAPPEPASDEIELSAPPFRLPTPALSLTRVLRSLAAILRSASCQTSPSGRR